MTIKETEEAVFNLIFSWVVDKTLPALVDGDDVCGHYTSPFVSRKVKIGLTGPQAQSVAILCGQCTEDHAPGRLGYLDRYENRSWPFEWDSFPL